MLGSGTYGWYLKELGHLQLHIYLKLLVLSFDCNDGPRKHMWHLHIGLLQAQGLNDRLDAYLGRELDHSICC